MEGLKRKIILDTIVTPFTMIPVVVGVSLLLLSEMLGAMAGFIGVCACLFGLAAFLTNITLNLPNISKRAVQQLVESEKRQRNRNLDALDAKLLLDTDTRDQDALRNLRIIYDSFANDLEAGVIGTVPRDLLTQIETIFDTVVDQLNRQHEVWRTSRHITGDLKKRLATQRDEMIKEIEGTVANLAGVINEVRALGLKIEKSGLSKLQSRLNMQLEVAKATSERLASLEQPDDLSRFDEYTK